MSNPFRAALAQGSLVNLAVVSGKLIPTIERVWGIGETPVVGTLPYLQALDEGSKDGTAGVRVD